MKKKHLDNILFLDIETVSQNRVYDDLDEQGKSLWNKKHNNLIGRMAGSEDLTPTDTYIQKAGIFAEFGKIICISVGFLINEKDPVFRIKSFAGHDEKQILSDFSNLLEKHFDNPKKDYLCGHNIKEFDIPYLCRRMLIQCLEFPKLLDISGKKPWDLEYLLDTMQMWKFGDYKNYTSLNLLTYLHDIPSPKDDIDGSQVGKVYYEEDGLERIRTYCEKDVLAVAKLFMKWQGFSIVDWDVQKVNS
jgi:predicted PolB exonuclease-like 3'-5' exonuclease